MSVAVRAGVRSAVSGLFRLGPKKVTQLAGKRRRAEVARRVDTVTVECPTCDHVGALTGEVLAKFSIAPSTPIAAFVKRCVAGVRQSKRVGDTPSQAVRKPPD